MTVPGPAPDDSTAATPLPVRVPVEHFFASLKLLLAAPGPFVTFYLPVHDEAARAASLDSIGSTPDLSANEQAFGRSLLDTERVADDAMLAGFLASDGRSFVQSFPEGPSEPLVERGVLPRLAPVIEAEQRLRHHLLAVASTEGVDLLTFPRHGRATMHRAAPGDADYTAMLIAEAAKHTSTPLVLIAAAADLAEDLAKRVSLLVPIETRVKIVAVDGDLSTDADLDSLADLAVQTVATDRAVAAVQQIRTWKFERSHGLGTGGVQGALSALREDDVRMVLVAANVDDERQAWFGPDPSLVAMDLQDASSVDGLADEFAPARLVDVVLRSAILRSIPVTVIPDLPDEIMRDGVGVVRSAVDA